MCPQAESTYIAHNTFWQIKMKIPWYNSRHTLISRIRDGKLRMIVASLLLCVLGSTNSASLQTPLILCYKSAVNSCMGIVLPVWTASTYNSHPHSPWKSLSNWAVQQALERGCKLRSAWTTLRSKAKTLSCLHWYFIGIKHTIEKLDSWPEPRELQRFMSTFLEYSPISGRPLHT